MSGKLDQSLDELTKGQRRNHPRRVRPNRGTVKGPSGGIAKKSKAVKQTVKVNTVAAVATAAAPALSARGGAKVIVSNLPSDVSEGQIQEYFGKIIGPVKNVWLTYGADGRCKGIATVAFTKASHAQQCIKELNGVKIDQRPMRMELVLDANAVAAASSAPVKDLGQRVSGVVAQGRKKEKAVAKSGPKSATAPKKTDTGKKQGGRDAAKTKRAPRPKKKTAEELDAEMTDYFGTNGNSNGAPVSNGGDTQMEVS